MNHSPWYILYTTSCESYGDCKYIGRTDDRKEAETFLVQARKMQPHASGRVVVFTDKAEHVYYDAPITLEEST